jgi:two-component system cell cycle response regulator CpdR
MGRKVLVVDDEPLVLDVVATMLEELGCHVETAHTGADALNRLGTEEHINILLADINMPGLDGRKLAYRAKQMRPELNVQLLSGRENDGYGFPIIRKPFLESDLKRVMSQIDGAVLTTVGYARNLLPRTWLQDLLLPSGGPSRDLSCLLRQDSVSSRGAAPRPPISDFRRSGSNRHRERA